MTQPPSGPLQPSPNAPGSTEDSRLIHLLLSLADEPQGRRFEWILGNVAGYMRQKSETAERYLRRDINVLRDLGMSIEESGSGKSRTLRLRHEHWAQPAPGLSDDELAVLFEAANAVFTSDELHAAALTGWSKIASLSRRKKVAKPGESMVISDKLELNRAQLATLLGALTPPRTTVEFWYSRQYGVADERRTLEPWRIINIRGRFYLLGYDPERVGARLFRFSRISEVVDTRSGATIPIPKDDLQEMAERMLVRNAETFSAVVRIREGSCRDVASRSRPLGGGRYELDPLTIDEIVRLGLTNAPDLVVESPKKARDKIVQLLREVIALHKVGGDRRKMGTDESMGGNSDGS